MPLKALVTTVLISAALVTAATADARVRLVSVSVGHPGSDATLVAAITPSATCGITVHYKSGPSRAKGLLAKRSMRGLISWTWRVGTNTTRGRWPITITCGRAGTLRTSFVVR